MKWILVNLTPLSGGIRKLIKACGVSGWENETKSMEMHDSDDHPNEPLKCTLSVVLKMVEMVNVRHVLPQINLF